MSGKAAPILAIHATARGFGFVVMSGPFTLVDWGTKLAQKNKNVVCLAKIEALIDRFDPHTIVLEDSSRLARRAERIDRLYLAIAGVCHARSIELAAFPRSDIHRLYATVGALTWYEIAEAVGRQLPSLARLVPPRRKAWQSEPRRMSMFTAAALAMVFWQLSSAQNLAAE